LGLHLIEAFAIPVERPQFTLAPATVVFHGDALLDEREIYASEPASRVLDPVLRHRV
jgi:hypothetical protein